MMKLCSLNIPEETLGADHDSDVGSEQPDDGFEDNDDLPDDWPHISYIWILDGDDGNK